MSDTFVLGVTREALLLAVSVGGPILAVSLAIGVFMGILQAATQVSEPTLSFVPKALAIAATVVVAGPWMLTRLTDFTGRLFRLLPTLTR